MEGSPLIFPDGEGPEAPPPPDGDTSAEAVNPNETLKRLLDERRAAIALSVQTLIGELRQLEEDRSREVSTAAMPEPTVEAKEELIQKVQGLSDWKAKPSLSREEYLRLSVVSQQIDHIGDPLADQYRQLEQDIRAQQDERTSLEYASASRRDEYDEVRPTLERHRKTSRVLRPARRIFKGAEIKSAHATESAYLGLQEKIQKLNDKVQGLEAQKEALGERLTTLSRTGADQVWRYSISNRKRGYVNQEVIAPVREQIEQEVQGILGAVQKRVISEYIETVVRPHIQEEIQRDDIRVLAPAEFDVLCIEQMRKAHFRDFMTRHHEHLSFSDQGLDLYHIPRDVAITGTYNRHDQTFNLRSDDGLFTMTFPEDKVYEMTLARWRFEPGQTVGRHDEYVIQEWSLHDQRLVLQDKEGQTRVYQGIDELLEFETKLYSRKRDYKTDRQVIYIDERDPRGYQSWNPYHREGEAWFIQDQEEGTVLLNCPRGSLTGEQCDSIVGFVHQVISANPGERENIIADFGRQFQAQGHEQSDLVQRLTYEYQGVDLSRFIRFGLLAGYDEEMSESGAQECLPYQSESNVYGNSSPPQDRVMGILSDQGRVFEHFLDSQFVSQTLPAEREKLLQFTLEGARRGLSKHKDPQYSDLIYLAEYGTEEDLYEELLVILDSNNASLEPIAIAQKRNPELFAHKVAKFGEMFATGDQEGLIRDLTQTGQDFVFMAKSSLVERMAKAFRSRIAGGGTPPEERFKLFRILSLRPDGIVNIDNFAEEDGSLNEEFARKMIMYLRTLPGIEDHSKPSEITLENLTQFTQDWSTLYRGVKEGKLVALEPVITQTSVLSFLARHPEAFEQVMTLPRTAPDFMELISPGGELESNRNQLIHYLFANGDILERAKSMVSIFGGSRPLHEELIAFVDARLHSKLDESESNYPLKIQEGQEEIETKFSELLYDRKLAVLADITRRTIEISRSFEAKTRASERNRNALPKFQFKHGMYVHGLPATVANLVLRNGNLCGELLGPTADADAYPFHIDYSVIEPERDLEGKSASEVLSGTITFGYGNAMSEEGRNLQVIAVTDRDQSEWEQGITYYAADQRGSHTLILGASPSTEIHAFLLRDPAASLPLITKACAEEEIYIPAYALSPGEGGGDGDLVFTYEDYLEEVEKRKPYRSTQEFLGETTYLDQYDVAQSSGAHRFTLKEHLLLATEKVGTWGSTYGLNEHEVGIVQVAARLHDVGKGAQGEQAIDNPVIASEYLHQVRGLSADDRELILTLIRFDELLGDILQGTKPPESFERIFPDSRQQRMLLCLYKGDVQAIDGDRDGESYFHRWQVEEKLHQLGLERLSAEA